jgi:hypothetical protein
VKNRREREREGIVEGREGERSRSSRERERERERERIKAAARKRILHSSKECSLKREGSVRFTSSLRQVYLEK